MNNRYDLYIAGPMSGYTDWNFPAFFKAGSELSFAGYSVLNPARHGDLGDWSENMRLAVIDLMQCAGIALLPGWEKSRGASIEYNLAKELGITDKTVDEWMERKHSGLLH